MYCNQCEQTAHGTACTVCGVCGKDAKTALIQDQLLWLLRRLAALVLKARQKGMVEQEIDDFMANAVFSTLTNVNFDPEALHAIASRALDHARNLAAKLEPQTPGHGAPDLEKTLDDYLAQLPESVAGIQTLSDNPDVCSAMEILLYGLKGVCAYADHAARLGKRDEGLSAFICRALIAGTKWDDKTRDLNGWLDLVLECGTANLKAMELLHLGNNERFGQMTPAPVQLGHKKGKAILISGHDMRDMEALLEHTEGTGIQVYTHGEMLPAHGYPRLKAFSHLAGHFGTAWENQQRELPHFPGPVLFNTNCIQNPAGYADKVFTTGNVGWPGCVHCKDGDFSAVIAKAKEMPGYAEDAPGKEVLTGFGLQTMLEAAPAVLEAVKEGKVRHIFLVGGCDGARPSREYYTEFVEKAPADTIILTLACGKFRFFDKELGKIGDLPRLMDLGQCNDAYTAVMAAVALAKTLDCSVNDLPLSLIISWYEQKAVAILLTLLALGVKNIVLGPTLPAFVSPNILNLLVEKWGIRPISTPEEDLKRILGA